MTKKMSWKAYVEFIGYNGKNKDKWSEKFWAIEVIGRKVIRNWGPIGKAGQVKVETFATFGEASTFAADLLASKKAKGYK